MRAIFRFSPIGLLFLLTLILVACGSSTSTSTSSYGSTSAATTSTTPTSPAATGKYYTPPTTSTGGTSGAAVIKTASATVNGKPVTILTNAQGMTLYYFTPDTKTTAACTGGCASTWPPVVITGTGKPTGAATLPGTLTAVTSANGQQAQYQGHFLYTYVGDSAAGQTNGEGIGGKWFVATTTIA